MANLWAEAADSLEIEERARLDSLLNETATPLEDVVKLIEKQKQACLDSRLKLRKQSGKVFYVRDILERITKWLDQFKQIGDVAVQYDSVHLSLPWAAVRFLLQTIVGDVETFTSVVEAIEVVTRETSRCTAIEVALLSDSTPISTLRTQLRQPLADFYKSAFSFLLEAARYYSMSTLKRASKGLVSPSPLLEGRLKVLENKAATLSTLVADNTAAIAEMTGQHVEKILSTVQEYELDTSHMQELAGKIDQQRSLQEHVDFLSWVSDIPHWKFHEQSVKCLVPGTGLWLQEKLEYKHFLESSQSGTFWLWGGPGFGKTKLLTA